MKLYLSNQEIVAALHSYLTKRRGCVRVPGETPTFELSKSASGQSILEVEGYEQGEEVQDELNLSSTSDNTSTES